MARKRNTRTSGGAKRLGRKAYQAWCRAQTLAGFTADPSGAWVRADRSRVSVQHLQAGYKAK